MTAQLLPAMATALTTLDDVLPRLARETASAPVEEEQSDLWFRDNDHPTWTRLDDIAAAADLVKSRSARHPWVTICRTHDTDTDHQIDSTFEVLGADPAHMYVCGDIQEPNYAWFWSSWNRGHHGRGPVVEVGPAWYQAEVFAQQVQTVHDALQQLEPALAMTSPNGEVVPGFWWKDRAHDHSWLEDLRKKGHDGP